MASFKGAPRGKEDQGMSARPPLLSRQVSGILGGLLLALAVLWLGWLVLHQFGVGPGLPIASIPGFASTVTPVKQVPPLTAAGISLGQPSQAPALTRQQALLTASQLEPDAAMNARGTIAEYVLLNYAGTNNSPSQRTFNNVPAWMVVYSQIPLQAADTSVDPTPFPQSHHDLYIFLDANSGKELLAIWV